MTTVLYLLTLPALAALAAFGVGVVSELRRRHRARPTYEALAQIIKLHQPTSTVPLSCEDYAECDGTDDAPCDAEDADEHEVPSCGECRTSAPDMDAPGEYRWPCPTARIALRGAR